MAVWMMFNVRLTAIIPVEADLYACMCQTDMLYALVDVCQREIGYVTVTCRKLESLSIALNAADYQSGLTQYDYQP